MINSGWIKLGIIGRAHGIRGSFFVSGRDEPLPSGIKNLQIGKTLETSKSFQVESTQYQNGRVVLKCLSVDSRDQAEAFTGQTVWVDKNLIQIDDSKEFLLSDLKGRTVKDDSGLVVGSVVDVIVYPGGVNISVVNPEKSKELDIPMSPDYIDMSFKTGTSDLNLIVPASLFDEIWNELKPIVRKKEK